MQSYAARFCGQVEEFLAATGMRPTTFGRSALGDPNFIFDLRKGRSPSAQVMDRVAVWIQGYERDDPPQGR
jgi:hypothetical protein